MGKGDINNDYFYPALVTTELYNYKDGFKYAEENGYAGNFFIFGSQDWILSKIIAGYGIKDIIKLNKIKEHLPYRPSGFSASDINPIDEISMVLIEGSYLESVKKEIDISVENILIQDLVSLNWQMDTIFVNTKTNGVLYAMVRR